MTARVLLYSYDIISRSTSTLMRYVHNHCKSTIVTREHLSDLSRDLVLA